MAAQLAVDIVGNAQDAAAAFDDVGDAAERMAADVADSMADADRAADRFDSLGESADDMASKSSQAAGGLGDLGGALSAIPGPIGAVGSGMEALAPAIMGVTGASDLLNLVTQSSVVIKTRDAVATARKAVVERASAVATRTMAVAQRVLNAAMRANPIGIVITLVFALVAVIVLAYKRSATFRAIVQGAMAAARTAVGWVVDKVRELVTWIGSKTGAGVSRMRAIATGAFNTVRDKVGTVIDKVSDLLGWVRDRVAGGFSTLKDRGGAALDAVKRAADVALSPFRAIRDMIESIVGWIGRIHFPSIPKGIRDLPGVPGKAIASAFDGGALAAAGGSTTVYSVTVNGALDPDAVARQVDQLLRRRRARIGG